ncbi:Kelch domain-containing protein 4 [Manis javanica]|nr:Kelch domain-containing protein 4 [Manis javanica]
MAAASVGPSVGAGRWRAASGGRECGIREHVCWGGFQCHPTVQEDLEALIAHLQTLDARKMQIKETPCSLSSPRISILVISVSELFLK